MLGYQSGRAFVFLSDALNSGLLDYFSTIFRKMLSYHAVGKFLFGGSHRGHGLAQVDLLHRLPLEPLYRFASKPRLPGAEQVRALKFNLPALRIR